MVQATGCGAVLEMYNAHKLVHTGAKDCYCPLCVPEYIYDMRAEQGTVCMSCGDDSETKQMMWVDRAFVCIECHNNFVQADFAACSYCMAPLRDGKCSY